MRFSEVLIRLFRIDGIVDKSLHELYLPATSLLLVKVWLLCHRVVLDNVACVAGGVGLKIVAKHFLDVIDIVQLHLQSAGFEIAVLVNKLNRAHMIQRPLIQKHKCHQNELLIVLFLILLLLLLFFLPLLP